ncbi:MAG TPA: hypothetical protein VFV81_09935, partial [Verrucomicrobiae bacterium]|nr:hypothetical protein [Verrucomicrobiae bacterium]
MNPLPANPTRRRSRLRAILSLAIVLSSAAFPVPAQWINLNFTAGTSYTGGSETSPATPSGPAGTWNNISLAAANTSVAVFWADGSLGPTLVMDTGRNGSWSSSVTTLSAVYTGSGSVYAVPNLYEAGLINGNNDTLGFRLKGLPAGTYTVNLVPLYRNYNANGATYTAGVHLYIGTGNDTDARDTGSFTLVTTNAGPEQYINSSLTTWVAATDGSKAYNYVTATVTIDSTNRWLTFLLEDAAIGPDRPGPAVIQIGPPNGTATSPVITQALVTPQGMILRGSNGPLAGIYQVISSTNIAVP